MGCCGSKGSEHGGDSSDVNMVNVSQARENTAFEPNQPQYEEPVVEQGPTVLQQQMEAGMQRKKQSLQEMRDDLMQRPGTFMLNNLVLAVEFFADYQQKDKHEINHKQREQQQQMNRKLVSQMLAGWYTGALWEQLALNYRVKPTEGMMTGIIGIYDNYMSHEFVKVEDDFNKCDPDSSAYIVKMLPTDRIGNYELKVVSLPRGSGQKGTDDSDDYAGSTSTSGVERDVDIPNDRDPPVKKKRSKTKSSLPSLHGSSASSALEDSSEENSDDQSNDKKRRYLSGPAWEERLLSSGLRKVASSGTSLDRLATPRHSLHSVEVSSSYSVFEDWEAEFNSSASSGTARLESSCFRRTYHKLGEEDVIPGFDVPKQAREQIIILSSAGFFQTFKSRFTDIMKKLGVSLEDLPYRKVQAPLIKYSLVEGETILDFTVTPTIPVKFLPSHCFEFVQRERQGRWPPRDIITKAGSFGCNLVPNTRSQVVSGNKVMNHWDVRFTRLESELLDHLPYGQIRCYIICTLLHQYFFKDIAWQPGCESMWLHAIFWISEKVSVWRQEKLGAKLQEILGTFKSCIQERRFPHYILKKRNLLLNIPSHNKNKVLQTVHVLLEDSNLLFHLIRIFKNLIPHKNFMPKLDFELLEKLLSEKDSVIGLLHGSLMARTPSNARLDDMDGDEDEEKKILREYRKKLVSQNSRISELQGKQVNPNDPSQMVMPKIQRLDVTRLGEILDLFASHFVRMAEKCVELDSYRQAAVYLNQADNLTILMLENCPVHVDKAREIQTNIQFVAARRPRKIQFLPRTMPSAADGDVTFKVDRRMSRTISAEVHYPPQSTPTLSETTSVEQMSVAEPHASAVTTAL